MGRKPLLSSDRVISIGALAALGVSAGLFLTSTVARDADELRIFGAFALLVAASDPLDQHVVGGSFARRYLRRPCGGRSHTGADHVVHGAIPFNHVPLNKLVRTGKIPTPVRDQLTVRRGSTR